MRYTGPACKLCRREGKKLFLKGERCMKAKCAIDRERPVPGASQRRRAKISDYGVQLRAKQQIRRYYGLSEKQFLKTFKIASKKTGITSFEFLVLLEMRLDNTVYRLGFASSRSAARQIINHGHIRVNGRKVDIPSYKLKKGDTIELKKSDKSLAFVQKNIEETSGTVTLPEWLTFEKEALKAEVLRFPEESEIQAPADAQLIVELYSK
ncbi:MAG: 30S ribosomal protein S4 [Victivallales bacterium]|nr:30S ribosomal protein S4 [Victivallales bacterium]